MKVPMRKTKQQTISLQDLIDRAMDEDTQRPRPYLGASQVGDECGELAEDCDDE